MTEEIGQEAVVLGSGILLRGFRAGSAMPYAELMRRVTDCALQREHRVGRTVGGTVTVRRCGIDLEEGAHRVPWRGSRVMTGIRCEAELLLRGITPEAFSDLTGGVLSFEGGAAVCEWDESPGLCWVGETSLGIVLIDLGRARADTLRLCFTEEGRGMVRLQLECEA